MKMKKRLQQMMKHNIAFKQMMPNMITNEGCLKRHLEPKGLEAM